MGRVVLYIATSLDGYIATKGGGIGWLDPHADALKSFPAFIRTIGASVMGRGTYDFIAANLPEGPSPYGELPSFVLTQRPAKPAPNYTFVSGSPAEAVKQIRKATAKDIWLIGGGVVIRDFLAAGLVDSMTITVLPVLLGDGIRLFPIRAAKLSHWKLTGTTKFRSGAMELRYERRAVQAKSKK